MSGCHSERARVNLLLKGGAVVVARDVGVEEGCKLPLNVRKLLQARQLRQLLEQVLGGRARKVCDGKQPQVAVGAPRALDGQYVAKRPPARPEIAYFGGDDVLHDRWRLVGGSESLPVLLVMALVGAPECDGLPEETVGWRIRGDDGACSLVRHSKRSLDVLGAILSCVASAGDVHEGVDGGRNLAFSDFVRRFLAACHGI